MVHRSHRFVTALRDRVTARALAILTGPPLGFFVFALLFDPTVEVTSLRRFLGALVTAQASVVAIVFSVTLLGVQLTATQYSSRLVRLYVEHVAFWGTLLLFGVSIGLDLFVLFNVTTPLGEWVRLAAFTTPGVALVAGYAIYVFTKEMLALSTPDRLLAAVDADLTPEKYRESTNEFTTDSTATHPLQPLYSIVMGAITDQERVTAEHGIETYESIITRLLASYSDPNTYRLQDRQELPAELFETPLEDQLPEIAVSALEHDESELTTDAIDSLTTIGETALEHYWHEVTLQAAEGLGNAIWEAPRNEQGNRIRRSAFRGLGALLTEFSQRPDLWRLRRLISIIEQRISHGFRIGLEPVEYQDHLQQVATRDLPTAHNTLLKHYGEYLKTQDIDWKQDYPEANEGQPNAPVAVLDRWRRSFLNISDWNLRFYEHNDEWAIYRGKFSDAWETVCLDAAKSGADAYAIVLCQTMIETAYVMSTLGDGKYPLSWELMRVKQDHPTVVNTAFRELKSDGRTMLVTADRMGRPEPQSGSRFRRVLDAVRGNSTDFDSWLTEYEQKVNERLEEARDS
jgi:hypothetical protein